MLGLKYVTKLDNSAYGTISYQRTQKRKLHCYFFMSSSCVENKVKASKQINCHNFMTKRLKITTFWKHRFA